MGLIYDWPHPQNHVSLPSEALYRMMAHTPPSPESIERLSRLIRAFGGRSYRATRPSAQILNLADYRRK